MAAADSTLMCVVTGQDCDPRCPGCILRAGGVWDSVGDRHWVFPGDPDYETIRIRQGGSWRDRNPLANPYEDEQARHSAITAQPPFAT